MSTVYKKVWRDLWRNKGRTFMVVISIAVGVMAVGMVMSANSLVLGQMSASHQASSPSHGWLYLRQRYHVFLSFVPQIQHRDQVHTNPRFIVCLRQ